MQIENAVELPGPIVQRIEHINREYLQLIKEICEIDPCAPAILGLSPELTEVLQKIRMSMLSKLARCGYLIPCLSLKDPTFWSRVADGSHGENDLLEQFVVRMSAH